MSLSEIEPPRRPADRRGRAEERSRAADASTGELEAQAERVARRHRHAADGDRAATGAGETGSPPESLRRDLEHQLGVDLGGVRLRSDRVSGDAVRRSGADAIASGDDIAFAPGALAPGRPLGRELLAHEMVHVAQQRCDASGRGAGSRLLAAPRGTKQMGSCGGDDKAKVMAKLKKGRKLTNDEARGVMKEYKGMGDADRDKTIGDLYSYGASVPPIRNLLDALSEKERVETYADLIKDMLQRVQRRASSAASGKSFGDMARQQGAHMESEARAAALKQAQEEAKKKKQPIPKSVSKAEVQKSFEKKVEKESEFKPPKKNEWTSMTKAEQTQWWIDAKKARADIIALAAKKEPAMKLKESDIALKPKHIAEQGQKRGMSLFALSGRPMTVGVTFMKAAVADPEYVLGAVLHEIYGHPMHGSKSESYAWKLFDESTKHFPSYSKPANRGNEKRLYGYPETEIYSEMIEAKHTKKVTPADRAKGVKGSDMPSRNIASMVGRLARNLEPSVAKAVFLGMWERFRIDPRIDPAALTLFKKAVNNTKGFKGTIR